MSVGVILSTEHKNIQSGELSVLHFVSAIIEMIFNSLLIKLITIYTLELLFCFNEKYENKDKI